MAATAAPDHFEARGARLTALAWRPLLFLGSWVGRLGRWVFVDARGATVLMLLAPAIVFAVREERDEAAIALGAWVLLLMLLAAAKARDRLIVGEFENAAANQKDKAASAPTVDLRNLLIVEISRLRDLFRVVGDRRAVSSGLGHQRALDATLSVDALVETLQGTVSADSKATLGPISLPVAPFVTLFGKLLQAPRLTGSLHRDGNVLILTAQTTGRGGLTWRVEAPAPAAERASDAEDAVVSPLVEELALRIYTDLALGRSVRWEASRSFVEGLRNFRSCLRTPKDRKVNLRRAEKAFQAALASDEDFPLVYYNLGVVYTELHGLAVAAGRKPEAETRLSAAETAFGRAIEKDPGRWECYFAFAQTQFRYSRYHRVVDLCTHILELDLSRSDEAKTRELLARALAARSPDGYREAVDHASRASWLALVALFQARMRSRSAPSAEEEPAAECAELAAGCLVTFSDILSRGMPKESELAAGGLRRWRQDRVRRRVQPLKRLAPMAHGRAELEFKLGCRALELDRLDLAVSELTAAAQRDPTRPSYSAGLALALAEQGRQSENGLGSDESARIRRLCLRALQGMVGAFFPARDANACEMVAAAYQRLDGADDAKIARQLRVVADAVGDRLRKSVDGASVSGIFLEELRAVNIPVLSETGPYAEAVQQAKRRLVNGRRLADAGRRTQALAELRAALQCADRATSVNPLSTVAWETLGDVHRELSDFQNARVAWEQALATDPDNPRLYDKIGSSYWHSESEGRTHSSREHLKRAAEHYESALILYGSGSFDEQVLTHYRLGKLHATLREFDEARRHLEIVEAVGEPAPIVGWTLLGFAYLEHRNFAEAEHYFRQVIKKGAALGASEPPDAIVGDRLDEQTSPLALVRAWGHLGLAITHLQREGRLARAGDNVDSAHALIEELRIDADDPMADERFPSRAPATIMECRGLILLRQGSVDAAVDMLDDAVSCHPHSRSYYGLALALEQQAVREAEERRERVARALRLLDHAVTLGPTEEPSAEVRAAMDRLVRLGGGDGRDGAG